LTTFTDHRHYSPSLSSVYDSEPHSDEPRGRAGRDDTKDQQWAIIRQKGARRLLHPHDPRPRKDNNTLQGRVSGGSRSVHQNSTSPGKSQWDSI
jgi:hypothetical protein